MALALSAGPCLRRHPWPETRWRNHDHGVPRPNVRLLRKVGRAPEGGGLRRHDARRRQSRTTPAGPRRACRKSCARATPPLSDATRRRTRARGRDQGSARARRTGHRRYCGARYARRAPRAMESPDSAAIRGRRLRREGCHVDVRPPLKAADLRRSFPGGSPVSEKVLAALKVGPIDDGTARAGTSRTSLPMRRC